MGQFIDRMTPLKLNLYLRDLRELGAQGVEEKGRQRQLIFLLNGALHTVRQLRARERSWRLGELRCRMEGFQ